jgi:beta-glucosidase
MIIYLDLSLVQSVNHRQIAMDAAKKSFVLLKNKNDFLPLKQRLKKIAVGALLL